MRSAKAPVMSAGVMMAKVSWKVNQRDSGMVPTIPVLTPFINIRSKGLPTKDRTLIVPSFIPASLNVMLYPKSVHKIVIIAALKRHWARILNTLPDRASPT